MIDFDALVLGPAYDVFGLDAALVLAGTDGREETLRVQDHTRGIEVSFAAGKGHVVDGARADFAVAALRPAASVRASELASKSLTAASLRDAAISFNGNTWLIKGSALKPDGQAGGEVFLLLEASA